MTPDISPSNDELLVAAYLWGDLGTEERAAFEARLANEPALQAELEFQRSVRSALDRDRLGREFRRNLETAGRETSAAGKPDAPGFPLRNLFFGGLLALLGGIIGYAIDEPVPLPAQQVPANPQAPEAPIAQDGGEEDEPLVGAGSKRFSFKAPLVRVAPAAGSLEIVLVEGSQQMAELERKVLAIQYLPGQMPDANSIQLLELELAGRKVLYLKMGGRLYPIREGKQGLVEERDAGVRGWLE